VQSALVINDGIAWIANSLHYFFLTIVEDVPPGSSRCASARSPAR
jgi:hypothetical protein